MSENQDKTPVEEASLDKLRRECHSFVSGERDHWDRHMALFMTRPAVSRILWWDKLYQSILDVPGVILEFGCQWGSSLAALASLRGIYEPFNHSRRIVGFDTFEGFRQIDGRDGEGHEAGQYATTSRWDESLRGILEAHEHISPLNHIRKFEIVAGDVIETVPKWLEEHPEVIVSMAIFDTDLYLPTKTVLEQLLGGKAGRQVMPQGSVLVFDQLSASNFPGETAAVDDVLGLRNLRLRRDPNQPHSAYAIL